MAEIIRPLEDPGRRLRTGDVILTYFRGERHPEPGRIMTPSIVNGVRRDEAGALLSLSTIYTSLASMRYDNPAIIVIQDPTNKRLMGIGEDDRAVHLHRIAEVPLTQAFLGDEIKKIGHVHRDLWAIFLQVNRATQPGGSQIRRDAGVSDTRHVSGVYRWSNLPGF